MKSGASEDPFSEFDEDGDDAEDEAAEAEATQSTDEEDTDTMAETTTDDSAETRSRDDYPYTLRRDNVKDERDEVHQLFVQDETHSKARDAERDLQDRLDEEPYRLDAREAIYLAGMANLDDAEAILRDWGYDL